MRCRKEVNIISLVINSAYVSIFFQVMFWSQQISFWLIGIMVVTSIRGLLITLTKVMYFFYSLANVRLWKSGFRSCPILLPGLSDSSIGLWNIFDDYLYVSCQEILQTCPEHPYGYPLCKFKNVSLQMQFYIEKNLINSPFKTVARFFVTQTKHSCI